MRKTIVALTATLALAGFTACEVPEEGSSSSTSQEGKGKGKASKSKSESEPDMTTEQENALEAAENYIDILAFSKAGLVRQLSSKAGDGYDLKDAQFAANNVDADWKAEAVEAAETYQEIMPMSRDGLIRQLTSSAGDQFTQAEAEYAANKIFN